MRSSFGNYRVIGQSYKDILPNPHHCGDMKDIILTTIITVTTCILFRRQSLLDVGLFDENLRFWQEYELTIRPAQRKPFYFVNEPLAVYRIDDGDRNRLTSLRWRYYVYYILTFSYWYLMKVKKYLLK